MDFLIITCAYLVAIHFFVQSVEIQSVESYVCLPSFYVLSHSETHRHKFHFLHPESEQQQTRLQQYPL